MYVKVYIIFIKPNLFKTFLKLFLKFLFKIFILNKLAYYKILNYFYPINKNYIKMYEKILQKLMLQREKNSNVSDRSLQDLARSLATVITTDEQLELADLSTAIKSIDGNINHYTKISLEKIRKEEADAKAKEDALEAEKATEEARKKAEAEGRVDITGAVAKAVADAIKPLMGEISSLKTEKSLNERKGNLESILKDAPEYFKNPIINGFNKTSFENDEEFTEYLSEIETSTKGFLQTAQENGLPTHTPAVNTKKPVDTGETAVLSDALKISNEAKSKE